MAFLAPDDFLVLQKDNGNVRRVRNGILQPDSVLVVAVNTRSERGLLGIAMDPSFPELPYIYLYYTESNTGSDTSTQDNVIGNRIYRYTWDGETLTNPILIIDLPFSSGPNHDGGIIEFAQ